MSPIRIFILAIGVFMAAVLVLFPSWYAIDPSYPTLIVPLGYAWIFSPPPPPTGLGMMVDQSVVGYVFAALAIVVTGVLCWRAK
jgi:hypothetical protein